MSNEIYAEVFVPETTGGAVVLIGDTAMFCHSREQLKRALTGQYFLSVPAATQLETGILMTVEEFLERFEEVEVFDGEKT